MSKSNFRSRQTVHSLHYSSPLAVPREPHLPRSRCEPNPPRARRPSPASFLAAQLSNPVPPLIQRITAAFDHSPICPRAPVVEFSRYTPKDLVDIFRPRINATLTCLQPIVDLDGFKDIQHDHRRSYECIVEKLTTLCEQLTIRAPFIDRNDWCTLEWGLKKIGAVSFKSLCRNLDKVCLELYRVERDAHFNWI